jgi:hypothetical protein
MAPGGPRGGNEDVARAMPFRRRLCGERLEPAGRALRIGEIVGRYVGPRLRDDEHDVHPACGRVR